MGHTIPDLPEILLVLYLRCNLENEVHTYLAYNVNKQLSINMVDRFESQQ